MPQTIERPATAGEVHFGLDEIFYSRTDHRGIIRAGNDIFQRVSGFSWEKLIGAPHKIVMLGPLQDRGPELRQEGEVRPRPDREDSGSRTPDLQLASCVGP